MVLTASSSMIVKAFCGLAVSVLSSVYYCLMNSQIPLVSSEHNKKAEPTNLIRANDWYYRRLDASVVLRLSISI